MATANELRQMNSEELGRMIGEVQQNIFNMRIKHRTGHLENTAELGKSRHELARLQTLIRETQLGIKRVVKAETGKEARSAKGAEKEPKKAARAKAEKAPAEKKAKKAAK
ncbi:MAG: 50S ribosomal protein L29 [Isosphaeraceae bacterium]